MILEDGDICEKSLIQLYMNNKSCILATDMYTL